MSQTHSDHNDHHVNAHTLAKALRKEKQRLDILRSAYKKLAKESASQLEAVQKEKTEIENELKATFTESGHEQEIREAINQTQLLSERKISQLNTRLGAVSKDRALLKEELKNCICGRKSEEERKREREEEEKEQQAQHLEARTLSTCSFMELAEQLEELQPKRKVDLSDSISLLSYRGKYFSRTTTLLSKYPFVANRDSAGSWEKVKPKELKATSEGLARYAFVSCAGKYIQATSDGYLKSGTAYKKKGSKALIVNQPKDSEIFIIGYSRYDMGSKISIRAEKTQKYVGVAKKGEVRCKTTEVTEWEWWTVVPYDSEPESKTMADHILHSKLLFGLKKSIF